MMRLIELRAENFKALSAVRIRPTHSVTPIVGRNGAGKTSVLDAIAAALGGAEMSPEMPVRKGKSKAEVILDLDEITVIRKWSAKGTSLDIVAKDGSAVKTPQRVLDTLVGQLSFDPLEFGRMGSKEQAATLARIAGIDLARAKAEREGVFNQRTEANRKLKEAQNQLAGMPPVEAPDEEVSIAAILDELKSAEKYAADYAITEKKAADARTAVSLTTRTIEELEERLGRLQRELAERQEEADEARRQLDARPKPEDPEPIRQRGKEAQSVNKAVQAKKARAKKEVEVKEIERIRNGHTDWLERFDKDQANSLEKANMPIPGLGLSDYGVSLDGIPFGQCSAAEQLRISVAIGLALNPKLKLMLIRDGSLLDQESRALLEQLAEKANAQVFLEVVDNGREVGVRIVDGEADSEAHGEKNSEPIEETVETF